MTNDPMYGPPERKDSTSRYASTYETGEIPKKVHLGLDGQREASPKDAPNSVEKGDAIWAEVCLIIIPCYH